MNRYKVWIDGRKETTVQFFETETSFQARQRLATQYNVKTFTVIAVRVDLLKQGE